MKLLIAGGGTGGHLFSGIAVARELLRRGMHEVLFVGARRGIEARLLPKEELPYRLITVGGLKRMGLLKTLVNLFRLPVGLVQSFWIVLTNRPDVALGVGGYASGPVILAAWLFGRPVVLIEQNSRPGLTNRILGRLAKVVVTHFKQSGAYFKAGKVRRLGTPIRPEFGKDARAAETREANDTLRLLITGGSQGARALNRAMADSLPLMAPLRARLNIRHQAGAADEAMLREAYKKAGFDAEVTAFIDDMVGAYADADLVIGRAGAGTCAELGAAGKPALLVPLPGAADDHQTLNAEELVRAKAAWMVKQDDLTPEYLKEFISGLIDRPEALEERSRAAGKAGRPDAASKVADLVLELAGETIADRQTAGPTQ